MGRESLSTKSSKPRLIFILSIATAFFCVTTTAVLALIDAPTTIPYISQPITTMQAMTPEICDKMPDDYSTMTLTDTRNGQNYRVRKMPDNKCWMIDNLKLATPGTALTLDHNNSNITDDQYTFVIPANPVQGSSTHSNGRCDSGGTLANGSGYLTCNGTTAQSTTNNGFAAYSDPSDPTITYISCSEGHMVDPASTAGCGYLYNWYTATAGTGTYELDGTTDKTQAPSSICPAGWRLPKSDGTSGTGNEFAVLNSAMYDGNKSGSSGSTTAYVKNWWHTGLFAGPRSGDYDSGFEYQGVGGYFWSSSAGYSAYAWGLGFYYDHVYPGTGDYSKGYGFAVRCVV